MTRRSPATRSCGATATWTPRRTFTIVKDDTGSTDTVYTDHIVDAAINYGYRIKAHNAHRLCPRSQAARVETLAESATEQEAESSSERDSDSDTESPTDTDTDFVEAWTSVLDVRATDGTVGYSRWAQFGSL